MSTLLVLYLAHVIIHATAKSRARLKDISLDAFPNPIKEEAAELCGRGQPSFICDPSQFLNPRMADDIDHVILNASKSHLVWCSHIIDADNDHEPALIDNPSTQTRENYNGLQIGVAIISTFKHFQHSRLRHDDDIARKSQIYAKLIHDEWAVGEAGCNNALMIFVNIYDKYLYVSTGSAIKGIITDEFVQQFLIPKYVRPLMRQQRYGEAIRFIIDSVVDVLRHSDALDEHAMYQDYVAYTSPSEFFGLSVETWLMMAMISFGGIFMGYKYHSERDYRQCETHLARLHAMRESRRFNQTSCPICLEDFPADAPSQEAAAPVQDSQSQAAESNTRETAILICGHKFCKDCLDSWFASQSMANQKCPICRHDRDDWSVAVNEEKNDDAKEDAPLLGERDDEKGDRRDERDNDQDRDAPDDDGGHGAGDGVGGGGQPKTSTSDTFYARESQSNGMRNRGRNGGHGNGDRNDWLLQQELLFRMNRIRYMYPRYVSRDMVDRWSRPGYRGSYTSDTSFRRANPNYRPPASGRSGSTWSSGRSSGFSFGGGSSAGGGGGGGGW